MGILDRIIAKDALNIHALNRPLATAESATQHCYTVECFQVLQKTDTHNPLSLSSLSCCYMYSVKSLKSVNAKNARFRDKFFCCSFRRLNSAQNPPDESPLAEIEQVTQLSSRHFCKRRYRQFKLNVSVTAFAKVATS